MRIRMRMRMRMRMRIRIRIRIRMVRPLADFFLIFFFYIRCIILCIILRMQPLGYGAIVLTI